MQEGSITPERWTGYIPLGSRQQCAGGVLTTGAGIAKTNRAYLWVWPRCQHLLASSLISHPVLWVGRSRSLEIVTFPASALNLRNSLSNSLSYPWAALPPPHCWSLGISTRTQLKKMWNLLRSGVKISTNRGCPTQVYVGDQEKPPSECGGRAPDSTLADPGSEASPWSAMLQRSHLLKFYLGLVHGFWFCEVMPWPILSSSENCVCAVKK